MAGDLYIRVVLTLIALCALIAVSGQLGILPPSGSPREDEALRRFQVTSVRAPQRGPSLLRIDTVTGEVWSFSLRDGTEWLLLGDPEAAKAEAPPPVSPPPEQTTEP